MLLETVSLQHSPHITTENQLLGEAEAGCSLEPRRVRPADAKLGNSARKNKNKSQSGWNHETNSSGAPSSNHLGS